MKKYLPFVAVPMAAFSTSVFAAEGDNVLLDAITASNFSGTILESVSAVVIGLLGVYVAIRGWRIVRSLL